MQTENRLEERVRFLDLGGEDLVLLGALKPSLERNADRLVNAFYRHLLSFAPMRKLLAEPEVKTRLLQMQRQYLLSLASPELDERYVADRLRIGQTHYRVGLEPRWYLGAYSLYFRLILPLISETFNGQAGQVERATAALSKLLMLDAQLAMEAYIGRREAQLEYLNAELGRTTREIEQVYEAQSHELREVTARATAAEELASIATVVAGLAHEIGTPMGVIQGHAELLESSVSDERGRWRLHTIREQIDRISQIIQTLLNMARPGEREHVRVELGQVIDQSLSFLGDRFRRRGIDVKLERSGEPAELLGDSQKLQQLFINLFLNAVDAMPEGGTLRVQVGRDRDRLDLRVCDTGQGIPPKDLPRIFDAFFTTKEASRGNGLGLMVAQGIVRSHGGEICAESRLGAGTEFRILFPAASPGSGSLRNP